MKITMVLPRIIVAVAVLALLAGCATPRKADPTMDHREAKSELSALFVAAQDAVGGDWIAEDGGAEDCMLPSGATGAQYLLTRLGPGVRPEQQQKVIDTVVSTWTDAGFKVKVSKLAGDKGLVITEIGYPGARAGAGLTEFTCCWESVQTALPSMGKLVVREVTLRRSTPTLRETSRRGRRTGLLTVEVTPDVW